MGASIYEELYRGGGGREVGEADDKPECSEGYTTMKLLNNVS